MLVKIGDVWVDPMDVTMMRTEKLYTEAMTLPMAAGTDLCTEDVVALYMRSASLTYVRGITLEEAAQRINACREQTKGRK